MLSSRRSALKLLEKGFIQSSASFKTPTTVFNSTVFGGSSASSKRNVSRANNMKRMNWITANQFTVKMNKWMMPIVEDQVRGYASLPKGGK